MNRVTGQLTQHSCPCCDRRSFQEFTASQSMLRHTELPSCAARKHRGSKLEKIRRREAYGGILAVTESSVPRVRFPDPPGRVPVDQAAYFSGQASPPFIERVANGADSSEKLGTTRSEGTGALSQ